jgi:hypothetical protein
LAEIILFLEMLKFSKKNKILWRKIKNILEYSEIF